MSNKRCRQAIESRLNTWASTRSPALPIAWENVPFNPPSSAYLRGWLLPAQTDSPDLEGALRTYRGVYQVSVSCPINTGPGEAEGIADELAALFPLNTRLAVTGLTLQIVSPVTAAQGVQDGDRYVVPVSFTYRADT